MFSILHITETSMIKKNFGHGLNYVQLPNYYIEILTLELQNVNLFGNRVIVDVIVKMASC